MKHTATIVCSLAGETENGPILRCTNTSKPDIIPLCALRQRFPPQARYRFSRFSVCFFLRSSYLAGWLSSCPAVSRFSSSAFATFALDMPLPHHPAEHSSQQRSWESSAESRRVSPPKKRTMEFRERDCPMFRGLVFHSVEDSLRFRRQHERSTVENNNVRIKQMCWSLENCNILV